MESNSSQQFIVMTPDEYLQFGIRCSETDFIARGNACALYSIFATTDPITTGSSENLATINVTNTQEEEDTTTLFIQLIPNQVSEIWLYVLVIVLVVSLLIIVILAIFVSQLLHKNNRRSQASSTDCKLYTNVKSVRVQLYVLHN